jgi:hypothetical protein
VVRVIRTRVPPTESYLVPESVGRSCVGWISAISTIWDDEGILKRAARRLGWAGFGFARNPVSSGRHTLVQGRGRELSKSEALLGRGNLEQAAFKWQPIPDPGHKNEG